ncbi:MAG: M14 family zinc carboxypeptidase [Gilvibacter sp.]
METPSNSVSVKSTLSKTIRNAVYAFVAFILLMSGISGAFAQTTDSDNLDKSAKRVLLKNITPEKAALLVNNGFDMQCGVKHVHNDLRLELTASDFKKLDELNFEYEVLIEDLTDYYAKLNETELPKAKAELAAIKAMQRTATTKSSVSSVIQDNFLQYSGDAEIDWAVPEGWELGASFGGCLTVEEVLLQLDAMQAEFPALISAKSDASITAASPTPRTTYGNSLSSGSDNFAGQTIYYVRIHGDLSAPEGTKPQILFTGMIHSREVSALMTNMFTMWYLLENYGEDPRITDLIDNNEIYFIPIVNPDGLKWNEIIAPGGGGMQRKNLRVNTGDSGSTSSSNNVRGVDLNRNFDYFWGTAGSGSSPTPSSDTYRGPSAFSEPETQILRDFILERDFKTILMNHSYANSIPHPYGGIPGNTSGREDEMHNWHAEMTRFNRYISGATIFSPANGIADDWMVGGNTDGNGSQGILDNAGATSILATTPEHGGTNFWPGSGNILPEGRKGLRIFLSSIYYGGKYARFHDLTQSDINSLSPNLTFGIERVGQTSSDFTVTVTAVSSNISAVGAPVIISGQGILDQDEAVVGLTLDAGILPNDEIIFNVQLSNDTGDVFYEAEITKLFQPSMNFSDDPESGNLNNWTATGAWNNSTVDGYTGTRSIRSTNLSAYANSSSGNLTTDPFDISANGETIIQFYTTYDLERNFDYVEILGSTDGTNYFPLTGKYNKPESTSSTNDHAAKGNASFQSGSSGLVYDGDRFGEWVMEEITISLGENSFMFGASNATVRFSFAADSNNRHENYSANSDGFYIDDFKVFQKSNEVECDFDVVNTFPYTEDLESGRGLWSEAQGDDGNWSLNTGSTTSSNTGPDEGNDPAAGGGQYLYTEASTNGLGFNANVILQSGCIDLTNHYGSSFAFDYHMFGADMGDLDVDVSTDGGLTWATELTLSGQDPDQVTNSSAWKTALIDLGASSYDGQVIRIRFSGTTGSGFNSDIAIDNLVVDATEVCTVTTTFSGGSWDNNAPTPNVQAVIASDYDMNALPSIDACQLTINNGVTVTVAAGTYLNIDGDITVGTGAVLDIQHEGAVVQIDNNSLTTNNGTINVRKTTPFMEAKDFSVMASPVTGETRDGVYASAFRAFAHNTANFDTNDAVGALVGDAINFVDQTGNDRVLLSGSEPINTAQGYLIFPQANPSDSGTYNLTYSATSLSGTLNNGSINKALIYNGSSDESANLIGNPYASAIDAVEFLSANSHIPVVYFWEHNTPRTTGPAYLGYTMEDISYYNSSGGTAAASDPGNIPSQYIASGQGFGVKPTSGSDALFNNDMRVKTDNNTFKSGPSFTANKIWLELRNQEIKEYTSTMLVAFLPYGATDGLDTNYDAKRIGTYTSLFSEIDGWELGIQGRTDFNEDDRIDVGFKTLLPETITYSIGIAQLEGSVIKGSNIYLLDNETGITTNISERDYFFTESEGHFPGRFTLFFKNSVLNTKDLGLVDTAISMYPNPGQDVITLRNGSEQNIEALNIFDIQGRKVMTVPVNNASLENSFSVSQLPQGVFMVEVVSQNTAIYKRLIKN